MTERPKETETESDVLLEEDDEASADPPKHAVVLYNDDYTTMDFVIEVLQRFFHKSLEDARRIMLEVHQHGKGVAGVYTLEIAETKASQVMEYARLKGFPLKCVVEPY